MKVPHVGFNEEEDAVAALELVATVSLDLRESPSLWKWVIMGMQNAMQAAMVLALQGTDGCGALREKSQKRNREWLARPQGPQPKVIMADYGELLIRVQKKELMDGEALSISGADWERLLRLNKLRRDFAHFNPKQWSIELKLLFQLMPVALKTVEYLLGTQPRVQAHLTDAQKERFVLAISTTRNAIEMLQKESPPKAGA